MSGPVVLTRLCTICKSPLSGLTYDQVFVCRSCGLAHEATPRGWHCHPIRLRGDGPIWLPFWQLTCRPRLSGPEDGIAAYSLPEELDIWVKAFRMVHSQLVGNPGHAISLSESLPAQRSLEGPFPPLAGARRGSERARSWATLFLLSRLDQQADVTDIELTLDIVEFAFVGMPFEVTGQRIRCVTTGLDFHRNLVDDFEEIIAASQKT